MATTTISGQYGFNGGVNVLGTLSTPAITLNGTDLQTTLSNISSAESTLQTGLTNGTIVPLNATNAVNSTKVAVTASSTTENVAYCIPFVTSSTGNATCETASSDLLFNPSNRTTTIRNLNIYGSIGQNGNGVPTIYTNNLNVSTNGNLKLGTNATLTLSDGSTDLQTSLNSKVDTSSAQTIAGAKTFSGLATFNGGISLPSSATETDSGNLLVGGTLGVTGSTNFYGSTSVGGTFQATGNSTLGSGVSSILTINSTPTFNWDTTFSGNISANSITATLNSGLVNLVSPSNITYQVDSTHSYLPSQSYSVVCSTASTNVYKQGSSNRWC